MLKNQPPQDNTTPLVRFHRLIPNARLPQRADRSAGGIIPARAARFCDAITTASAFGYYIFCPIDLSLMWDGSDIWWSHPQSDGWMLLEAAQFPGFSQAFDTHAPEPLAGTSPPFLTALPEPGHLQIWTGLFARTAPDWSLLLRPVANFPANGGFVAYEGVVETDRWFGPLFTNIRLTRTHTPIRISAGVPFVQAQPLPRWLLSDAMLGRMDTTSSLSDFSEADWADYNDTIVRPNQAPDRPLGAYAVASRRRRRCPMSEGRSGGGHQPAETMVTAGAE
jgi:hypothetical protein